MIHKMLYPMQRVLRLCKRRAIVYKLFTNHARTTHGTDITENIENRDNYKNFESLLHENQNKITFSSYLEREKVSLGYFKYYLKSLKRGKQEQERAFTERHLPPLPLSLQYYVDKDKLLKEESNEIIPEPDKAFQLPFAKTTEVEIDNSKDTTPEVQSTLQTDDKDVFDRSDISKWMRNYEHFDDSQEIIGEWSQYYGKADQSAPISHVPCGGCGALLHCNDPAIPGYLPSEIFLHREDDELKTMECQRCHFLKEYNIALDVNVQPEEYEKLLQSIR